MDGRRNPGSNDFGNSGKADKPQKPRGEKLDSAEMDKIRKKLREIIHSGEPTPYAMMELLDKFSGATRDVLDTLFDEVDQDYEKARQEAREMVKRLIESNRRSQMPVHTMLSKIQAWMKEKGKVWSPQTQDLFMNEMRKQLTGENAYEFEHNQNIASQRSRINRALGAYERESVTRDRGLVIADSEQKVLNEILTLHDTHRNAYMNARDASLIYRDLDLACISGVYDPSKHDPSVHAHPLIAVLFGPKFQYIDTRALQSDLSHVVYLRHNKKQMDNYADKALFSEMISDPNDVVCNIDSPMADILLRCKAQIHLRKVVSEFRNGQYYTDSSQKLIQLLSGCRDNLFDNPDTTNDERSLLRKLMGVFSMRPTIVITSPSMGVGPSGMQMMPQQFIQAGGDAGMQISMDNMSFNSRPAITYTAISNISVTVTGSSHGSQPMSLDNVTSHMAWITGKDGKIQLCEQSVYASNGLIIFTVQRRSQKFDLRLNTMLISQLPYGIGVMGNDSMNNTPIKFPDSITLSGGLKYDIRSVLTLTETDVLTIEGERRQVTGCNAYICAEKGNGHEMDSVGGVLDQCFRYDPYAASRPIPGEDGGFYRDRPFSRVNPMFDTTIVDSGVVESFYTAASKRGVIFVYGLCSESKMLGSRNASLGSSSRHGAYGSYMGSGQTIML